MNIDLALTIFWALTLFVAAAIGGAIVQRITRDARRERDAAHKATEESQSATIQALKEERETNTRRIRELEEQVTSATRRITELEGAIKTINENVTGRPAFAELTVFLSRGFDTMEKSQQLHEERMGERHGAMLAALANLGTVERRRRRPK